MWGRGIAPVLIQPLKPKRGVEPYVHIGLPRGLGAHASSVLINSIGVPRLYANVSGYSEYEHAGSVRSQALLHLAFV